MQARGGQRRRQIGLSSQSGHSRQYECGLHGSLAGAWKTGLHVFAHTGKVRPTGLFQMLYSALPENCSCNGLMLTALTPLGPSRVSNCTGCPAFNDL